MNEKDSGLTVVSLLLLKSGAIAFESSEVNVPMIRMEFCDFPALRLSAAHELAEHWRCLFAFLPGELSLLVCFTLRAAFAGRPGSCEGSVLQGALSTLSILYLSSGCTHC